ncbi:MAG: DNA primase [Bacillota bacterium]|jgi:DNA primase
MSTYVPPQIIEEISQKTDIVELISEYLTLKKQGKNFVGNCPFHSENTPSFTVSPEKQIFYCFGCQKGGSAISFIMEIEGLTFPEAALKLAARVGVEVPERAYTPQQARRQQERQDLLRIHELADDFYQKTLRHPSHPDGVNYCHKRGLSEKTLTVFSVGLAPEHDWTALTDYLQQKGFSSQLISRAGLASKSAKTGRYYDKFHGRLIFPICDFRGQVIAFGGRIIGQGQPKYLNSADTPIYNKHLHLYALHLAAQEIRRLDAAVIMEGYMDVLAAHQHGVKNAVASLGTALSIEQVRLLKRYTNKVFLAYDGDAAGAIAAQRGLEIMEQEGLNIRVLSFPEGLDPDGFLQKYGKKGWDKFIKEHSEGVLEYLLNVTMAKYPALTIADKGLIIKELLPIVKRTGSYVEKESFINLLSQRLKVDRETIYADFAKQGLKILPPQKVAAKNPEEVKYAKDPSFKKINPLWKVLLENEQYFKTMKEQVGEDFCRSEEEKQLIGLVEQLGEQYDWKITTLLHILPAENEGLRQLLLNLLQTEIPGDDQELFDEWIKRSRLLKLQTEIKLLRQDMPADLQQAKNIVEKITALQQEVQRLKP